MSGDDDARELSELRDRLDAARTDAANELRERADERGLREAAARLGWALRAVADDQRLWDLLSVDPRERPRLTDEQLTGLEAVAFVDWTWLLERIEYQPPPDLDVSAAELAIATAQVLAGGELDDVGAVRERLAQVADALRRDAEDPHVPKRQRRGRLRRALKVAAKASIFVGATVAVVLTVPVSAPVALAVAGAVAPEAAVQGLRWTLDRFWPDAEPRPPDLAAEALRTLAWLDSRWLKRLRDEWSGAVGEATDAEPVVHLKALTHVSVERLLVALYELRDVAADAPWREAVGPDLRTLRELLEETRRTLRGGADLDARRLADLLEEIALLTTRLRGMLTELAGR